MHQRKRRVSTPRAEMKTSDRGRGIVMHTMPSIRYAPARKRQHMHQTKRTGNLWNRNKTELARTPERKKDDRRRD